MMMMMKIEARAKIFPICFVVGKFRRGDDDDDELTEFFCVYICVCRLVSNNDSITWKTLSSVL